MASVSDKRLATARNPGLKFTVADIACSLGAARAIMDTMIGTGMLERGYELFKVAEVVPGFSAMLKKFGQRLFRLDDLGIAPPEVIDKFLLDTPIDILCSGAPPLHSWWEQRKKTIR